MAFTTGGAQRPVHPVVSACVADASAGATGAVGALVVIVAATVTVVVGAIVVDDTAAIAASRRT